MEQNIKPLIKLTDVSKFYKSENNVAMGLHTVSTKLYKNEIIAVTGQSGSGKSTFLNVITGVDSYESGNIYFNEEDTSYFNQADMEKYRKDNVGFIFQNYNLVDSYTVLQNVMVPLLLKGYDKIEAQQRAIELINKVGIYDRIKHKATRLSGGEKQRCVIARALAVDAPILACDEPTGNLDSATSQEIINLIKEVSKDKLVLIVTHDYEEIRDIATRRLRFADGDLVEDVEIKQTKIESNDVLDLENVVKMDFKTRIGFGIKNTFATPKKFIFSLVVFLAATFAVGSIYASYINNLQESDNTSTRFSNIDNDRVLAYNNDRSLISDENIEKASDDFYQNSMFTNNNKVDSTFTTSSGSTTYGSNEYYYLHIPSDFDLTGRLPENETEIVLFRNTYGNTLQPLEKYIGETGTISFNNVTINVTVVGVSDTSSGKIFFDDGFYNPFLYDKLLNSTYSYGSLSSSYEKTNINNYEKVLVNTGFTYSIYRDLTTTETIDGESVSLADTDIVVLYNSDLIDTINKEDILDSLTYSYYGYDIKINSLISNSVFIDVKNNSTSLIVNNFIPNSFSVFSFYVNGDNLEENMKDKIYMLETFSKDKSDVVKLFSDMSVVEEADYSSVALDDVISKIINSLSWLFVFIIIFIIFFISYFILSTIFRTKTKDYTMLRSLGMSKSDMASSVRYETVLLGFTSVGLFYLVIFIMNVVVKTSITFFEGFNNLGFINYFVFLVFMILFSILISNRFNRKLFKTTVNESLKKEELHND